MKNWFSIQRVMLFSVITLIAVAAFAQTKYWKIFGSNSKFSKDVEIVGGLDADSTFNVDGAATIASAGSFTNNGKTFLPATSSAISLTSPTVTFSVAAVKTHVTLNADANLTGVYPTGGTMNQVIIIKPGTGSNTMRLDDGTSMTIGGNITLTEAQGDVVALQCVSADGDEWLRLWNADN